MLKRRLLNDKPLKLYTKRFYPAGTYTWIVPPGCTEVDVFLVGGGSGAGQMYSGSSYGGGAGGTFGNNVSTKGGDGTVLIRYYAY